MTDRETVRAGYDALGRTYADRRSIGPTELELLDRTLAHCADDDWLLDAGCGPAPTLAHLSDRARSVGLDVSAEQLAIAAEIAPMATLVRGDTAVLPFAADSFDAVVSLGVLMHLPNAVQERALAEFERILRPGGRLLVSDGEGAWAGENSDWLGSGVTMSWEMTGIDAVAAALVGHGFDILHRSTVSDELADDADASQRLLLAELTRPPTGEATRTRRSPSGPRRG